jgi:hypothetical protein
MPTTVPDDPSAPFAPPLEPNELREVVGPLARAIALHAVLLGLAADLLLRDGFTGIGFPIWTLLLLASATSLVWRDGRPLPDEAVAWLATALLFASALAWRGSMSLQPLNFLATLLALGMAAIVLGNPRDGLFAERLRDTVWAGITVIGSVAVGAIPLAFRDAPLPVERQDLSGRFRPVLRATLIAVPLLLVFGSLLRSADPIFASVLALPALDIGMLASHVVIVCFFAWVVAGWARGALIAGPSRARAPEGMPFAVGRLDVTAALGVLNALFALYVITQLGWFFGGERFLQERTGLSAAQYARQGFFQMVWVVLLVVPILLGTRAALQPGRELERWHTRLSLPLIGLLGVMIVSALLRLRLYVHYYGLTIDRFYPLVFMGWLSFVLACLALTVLRGRPRMFAGAATIAGLLVLGGLNIFVPDVIVARVNVARAHADARADARAARPRLDLDHLARLGAEAVPIAVTALLSEPPPAAASALTADEARDRCGAANLLLSRWWPTGEELARRELRGATWRSWNRGETEAARVVAANVPALRAVQRTACARLRDLSPRGERISVPAGS